MMSEAEGVPAVPAQSTGFDTRSPADFSSSIRPPNGPQLLPDLPSVGGIDLLNAATTNDPVAAGLLDAGQNPVSAPDLQGAQSGNTNTESVLFQQAQSEIPNANAAQYPTITGEPGSYQQAFVSSIGSRIPSHEPWPFHPKGCKPPRQGLQGTAQAGGQTGSPSSPGGAGPGTARGGPRGPGQSPSGSPGANNYTYDPAQDTLDEGTIGLRLAAITATMEGGGAQAEADVLQSMINRANINHNGYGPTLYDQLTQPVQYTPISSALYGAQGYDRNADAAYGGRLRGVDLREILSRDDWAEQLSSRLGRNADPVRARSLVAEALNDGPLMQNARAHVRGATDFRGSSNSNQPGDSWRGGSGDNKFRAVNADREPGRLEDLPEMEGKIPRLDAPIERSDEGDNPSAPGAQNEQANEGTTPSSGTPSSTTSGTATTQTPSSRGFTRPPYRPPR